MSFVASTHLAPKKSNDTKFHDERFFTASFQEMLTLREKYSV